MSLEKLKERNDQEFARTGRRRRMFIKTYGCQMNVRDSEKLRGILTAAGYEPADGEAEADVIVYNTCCVRENAEKKVYGHLGVLKGLKERKPDMVIAVCGCMTQSKRVVEDMMRRCRHVDVIFGTFNIHRLAELLYTHLETGAQVVDVWKEQDGMAEDVPSVRKYSYKAGVNIMYGCDNFCSYCIVPYVRGRERSRRPGEILAEVKGLAADGVKEVTLLGQNVNSYDGGLEPGQAGGVNFAALLRMVSRVEGLARVRFLTSHPKDLSDELIAAMKECGSKDGGNVCGHVHLPVQSGSDKVLAAMNRRYTREHYLALLEKMRGALPGAAVTTDIIVGFPGETEEDFQDTLDLVRRARFAGAFTFMYSIRTGTPAATMEGQVPRHIVKDRFDRLLNLLNPMIHEENKAMVGKIIPVLAEGTGKGGLTTGRSDCNRIVHFRGNDIREGSLVPVRITDCQTFYLIGEAL